MDLFEYEPLDLGGKSLRLLMLHPGVSGEVTCDLIQATLERGNRIPYEALSYAWGSHDLSESITVNGKRLPVTKSLFHALNHLRHDEGRVLWVDAVCIDQANTAERGHQVGQMVDIYRAAEQVLIWLGPSSYETKIAMAFLKTLHRETTTGRKDRESLGRVQEQWLSAKQDLTNDRVALCQLQRDGLVSIFQEPWFTRVWILQEVSHARAASVCCGRWSVPAHVLSTAAALVGVDLDPERKAVLDLMPSPSTKRYARTKKLYNLLQEFRGRRATDPRDMVYALAGIASDMPEGDPEGLLRPDYTKSEVELVRHLQLFLFGDLEHQPGQFSNLGALLAVLPELSNMTFRNAIANGRVAHMKMLVERGQIFVITTDMLLGVSRERLPLTLRGLYDLRSPNIHFNSCGPCGLEAILEQCDPEAAKCLLVLTGWMMDVTDRLVTTLARPDGKRRARRAYGKLFRRGRGGVHISQEEFGEMAAVCNERAMRTAIERQQQVYLVDARVMRLLSWNQKYGRKILRVMLMHRDGWVRVTDDGLLKILEYNNPDTRRLLRGCGILSVTVTGVGTNPFDPADSWASTVDLEAKPFIFEIQAEEVSHRLRMVQQGEVKAEVVYAGS
ncbi:HET domain-containing protein [Colletotrichum falcatum]|nr:HET domain-containing protein [Colletotrichum falcatum]